MMMPLAWLKFTDVPEEGKASIFKVEEQVKQTERSSLTAQPWKWK
jgi:hypothetical protein